MNDLPGFLLITCQIGAETAVKHELARRWPDFRFAYSRPGFLTFRLPPEHGLRPDFDLESVFARAYAFSLGKVTGNDPDELARGVWQVYGLAPPRRIHVWERDSVAPGDEAFGPPVTAAAVDAAQQIYRHCPHPETLAPDAADQGRPARPGEHVLDCVIVHPNEWWVGCHRAKLVPSLWAGGAIPVETPPDMVSRAYLKMEEALRWSRLPIPAGARSAELGSAPGGASQALLKRGVSVLGIDPADMHPAVLAHPHFTHLRRRANQVRRREFRKIRWLMADMNVAPNTTLEAVESIVTHPEVHVRGMILTLKLIEWESAGGVPEWLRRIRGWGYNIVRARQLLYNRQEICVSALQKPFVKRLLRGVKD